MRRPVRALVAVLATLAAGCSAQAPAPTAAEDPATRTSTPSRGTPRTSPSDPGTPTALAPTPTTSPARLGTGWGPTRDELRRAHTMVERLTLREQAGQVIVAHYSGTRPPVSLVRDLHLGGVIVFDHNITGTDQLRRSNRALRRSVTQAGRRWPLFVGVDQEGGIVERVKGRATRFPTFMTQGAARDLDLTTAAAAGSGAELSDLGFTVVFAPDADVTTGPGDPTIGSRSAGSAPGRVARQVVAAVDGYLSSGILPVVKHFPGHGSVPADSHEELPVQDRSLRKLRRTDLVPFRSAVRNGVSAIMVAHIDVRAVDPGVPSSLSRKVVTGLLRQQLGFKGLVVTDALNMAGVAATSTSAESAVRALRAGADVLLMPPDPRAAQDGVVRAVREGRLSRARLVDAATRQVAMLLHQDDVEPSVTGGPGSARGVSHRLSAAGITSVAGPCSGRLVGRAVRVSGPSEAVAAFEVAADRAGLRTGSGTTVALVGYGGSPVTADVAVAMDTPYVLGRSRARSKIALYGDTPGAMRALVDVLRGRRPAPGQLPVPVRGVTRTGC